MSVALLIATSFSLGFFVESIIGFGGGLIVVPLLYSLLPHSPYTMHIAVATSLAVMLVNTLFASYKHQSQKNIQC
jgi:uncharacterized membrane protein YfcA